MLTASQVRTVAYRTEGGELICREHAVELFEDEGGDAVAGYTPVIAYELDEIQTWQNEDWRDFAEDSYPDCTEDCEPVPVICDQCGAELVEAYHYGHKEDA